MSSDSARLQHVAGFCVYALSIASMIAWIVSTGVLIGVITAGE